MIARRRHAVIGAAIAGALAAAGATGCGPGAASPPAQGTTATPTAERKVEPPLVSPETTRWIAELDDPREVERAITELEALGDPAAIPALIAAWNATDRPVRTLHVIIGLARPLTPADARAAVLPAYEADGRPAAWELALPALRDALAGVDPDDPRSLDGATLAADALGQMQTAEALALLAAAATRELPGGAARLGISVIVNLARYRDRVAVDAVVSALRAATDRYDAGGPDQRYDAIVAGAAINALAEIGSADATDVLIITMYRLPILTSQSRRALSAIGPRIADEMRRILRGEHAAVNDLFAARDQNTGARDFYAAIILGDVAAPGDAGAVADLLAALARPAAPVYYDDDGVPSPNTQWNAIYDALRRIGPATIAPELRAVWMDRKAAAETRALAAAAYGMIAADERGSPALRKLIAAKATDEALRSVLVTALARTASTEGDLAAIKKLADGRRAKQRPLAHALDADVARVEVAIRCQSDAACYAGILTETRDDLRARLGSRIRDLDAWGKDELAELARASVDRAMIALGRMGSAAADQVPALLDGLGQQDWAVRERLLWALRRIAPAPCDACVRRLTEAIEADAGVVALAAVRDETVIVRNYFR